MSYGIFLQKSLGLTVRSRLLSPNYCLFKFIQGYTAFNLVNVYMPSDQRGFQSATEYKKNTVKKNARLTAKKIVKTFL